MKIPHDATNLERDLIADEGVSRLPYEDSKGILSVGIGHNLEAPMSDRLMMLIFREDLRVATMEAERNLPYLRGLDPVRRDAILNMAFNMGFPRFLSFVKMHAAMERGDYDTAADEAKDSKWYREDVQKSRSERIIHMIRTGRRPRNGS